MLRQTVGLLLVFLWLPLSVWARKPLSTPTSAYASTSVDHLIEKAQQRLATQPDSAFLWATQALQSSTKEGNLMGVANSHEIIGTVFFYRGVYNEALTHLLQAEKLYKQLDVPQQMAANLNQQGLVYYNIRQPELALQHHQEALQLYEKLNDNRGMAYSYGCLGHLYEKRQLYSEGLQYQQKALAYYEAAADKQGKATILENIGSIYEDQAKYGLAQQYFRQSVALHAAVGDSLAMIVGLNNLGDIYRKTGNNQDALLYTFQALQVATRFHNRDQISSAYKDLSKIYQQIGDYRKAYENLELGRTLYEDMYAEETTRQLNILQTLFQIERKNSEIQLLENRQRLDYLIKLALGIGISLTTLLGGLVINRQKLKLVKNKEIMEQNRQKFEAENRLMQAELENIRLREWQLQNELETRAKSLTAHTLHLIGKNKILEDIRQRLIESLREDPKLQRKKLTNLVKMIEHNFVQDKDWADFRQIFEQVHQDFFENIQGRFPELSAADTRLAALIKLNLPSKDMATTMGISSDSLRIARYRLKKKLGLTAEENLTNFIQGL